MHRNTCVKTEGIGVLVAETQASALARAAVGVMFLIKHGIDFMFI